MRQVYAVIFIALVLVFFGALSYTAEGSEAGDPTERISRLAERAGASADVPTEERLPLPEELNREPIGASTGNDTVTRDTNPYTGGSGWIMSTLTSLGLVIGLILALRWGWTKMGGKVASGVSPVVEVLSRTSVAPKNQVMLLRVGPRILVVSDSSSGMQTLCEVTDAEEVADLLASVSATKTDSISQGFGQLMRRFNKEYDPETGSDEREVTVDRARASLSGTLARIRSLQTGEGTA